MEKRQYCGCCSCLPWGSLQVPWASQRILWLPHLPLIEHFLLLPALNRGKPRWGPVSAEDQHWECKVRREAGEMHRGPQLQWDCSFSSLLPPHWGSHFVASVPSLSSSAVAKAEAALPNLFIGRCTTPCAFLQPYFGPGRESSTQGWYKPGCCCASETCQCAAEPAPVLVCCNSCCQSPSSEADQHMAQWHKPFLAQTSTCSIFFALPPSFLSNENQKRAPFLNTVMNCMY